MLDYKPTDLGIKSNFNFVNNMYIYSVVSDLNIEEMSGKVILDN